MGKRPLYEESFSPTHFCLHPNWLMGLHLMSTIHTPKILGHRLTDLSLLWEVVRQSHIISSLSIYLNAYLIKWNLEVVGFSFSKVYEPPKKAPHFQLILSKKSSEIINNLRKRILYLVVSYSPIFCEIFAIKSQSCNEPTPSTFQIKVCKYEDLMVNQSSMQPQCGSAVLNLQPPGANRGPSHLNYPLGGVV